METKGTISKAKRQPSEWEKIIANEAIRNPESEKENMNLNLNLRSSLKIDPDIA